MAILNTVAVAAYAAIINVVAALAISSVLSPDFSVGITIIDTMIAILSTNSSETGLLIATGIIAAIVAVLAKGLADLTVQD